MTQAEFEGDSLAASSGLPAADALLDEVEAVRSRLRAVEAEALDVQSRLAFLATGSAALGSSLDVGATLATLGNLFVPRLGDWLIVHLLDDGALRPASVVHLDPAKAAAGLEAEARRTLSIDDPSGPGAVARTGTIESVPADEGRAGVGLIVPLVARGQPLGTLTLLSERLDIPDTVLVEELAWRAALAIDNARLHARAEEAQALLGYQTTLLRTQAEASLDGLLVTSPKGEVLEWNRRLGEIFGLPEAVLTSRSSDTIFGAVLERVANPEAFLARIQSLDRHPDDAGRDEVVMTDGRVIDRYGAPLVDDAGVCHGRAWYFRDITDQKRWEQALVDTGDRFAALARTLQESLLPPDLPDVPGVELAAGYRPARGGLEMGGDFYDVFQTSRNTWALVMGDVCGKGAGAARITGLARYTLRAAAMQAKTPSDVLRVLNDALLRHPGVGGQPGAGGQPADAGAADGHLFVTAAYATLRPSAGRVRLALGLGGHPRPFVIRAAGRVEAVGEPGLALGLFDDPPLSDREINLRSGDTVVFFTDGVTEARNIETGEQFGEERLRSLLASLAGASAADVAAAVEIEAVNFGKGRVGDDIAVLAARVALAP